MIIDLENRHVFFYLSFRFTISDWLTHWIRLTHVSKNCARKRWACPRKETCCWCQWISLKTMSYCNNWMNVSICCALHCYFILSWLKWKKNLYFPTDELEEVTCYSQRINSRLATIDLCVMTVRDTAQEEALHQVNSLIDSLITSTDRLLARQRCQTFLNGCSFTESTSNLQAPDQAVDKKFEMVVLGCTLDDQKVIKKRLQALMTYLNKQTVSDWIICFRVELKRQNS